MKATERPPIRQTPAPSYEAALEAIARAMATLPRAQQSLVANEVLRRWQ